MTSAIMILSSALSSSVLAGRSGSERYTITGESSFFFVGSAGRYLAIFASNAFNRSCASSRDILYPIGGIGMSMASLQLGSLGIGLGSYLG